VVRLETLTAPFGDRAMTATLGVTRLPRRLQLEAALATFGRLDVVANVTGHLRPAVHRSFRSSYGHAVEIWRAVSA